MVKKILVVLFATVLSACASTYQSKVGAAHTAYKRGDYTQALEIINKVSPSPRDRLLYLLDKGMILHAAGQYEESNKVLTEAEEISSQNAVKSATREVAGTLWSEEAITYSGDKHERATIPVLRMLNYIMLGDWDGALVEVRHTRYFAEKIYGNPKEFDNAFSLYLSAIIWETLGHINDALIDYKQLTDDKKNLLPIHLSESKMKAAGGQLIVILETGISPHYIADEITTGYFSVSVPVLVGGKTQVDFANVKIDGQSVGKTYSFYNISEDIFDALKSRQKRSFVRKMIKLAVQGGLYGAGSEMTKSKDAGDKAAGIAMILLGLSMSAAEQADTRSWRTLPADFQIGRFYLTPGSHEVEVIPSGNIKTSLKKTVDITKNKPTTLLVNYPESGEFTKLATAGENAQKTKESKQKELQLETRVKSNPSDGDLKFSLATTKMERGNYDVEKLLEDALKNSSDRKKTIEMLIIANTINGNLTVAENYAKMADSFQTYEKMLSYINGGIDKPDNHDLKNAFDYYLQGLMEEKVAAFDKASVNFSNAYKKGLLGDPVIKKIMNNYEKTDKSFRQSEEGIEVATSASDAYLK